MSIMKTLFASTAMAGIAATGVFAQTVMSSDRREPHAAFLEHAEQSMLKASDVIGATIYAPRADASDGTRRADGDRRADGMTRGAWDDDAWENVGEITDALITEDGDVVAVLVDIGGFLGIGAKTVAMSLDSLSMHRDPDGDADDVRITVDLTREQLENAPEFEEDQRSGRAGSGGREIDQRSAERRERLQGFSRDGFERAERDALTADDINSASVYDLNDDSIGSVRDLVMADDGAIGHAVVDIGGFLGWGTHTVALPFDEVSVLRSDNDVRVYVDFTRDELEAMPEYGS